jgi:hypothetical protein
MQMEKKEERKGQEGREVKENELLQTKPCCKIITSFHHFVDDESKKEAAIKFIDRLYTGEIITYSFYFQQNESTAWNEDYKKNVKEKMKLWCDGTGIEFKEELDTKVNADVRIAIEWNGMTESWSCIGKSKSDMGFDPYNSSKSDKLPTMNFCESDLKESSRHYMILHQLGHCLGLDHEYSRNYLMQPNIFNKDELKKYLSTFNWDVALVDKLVLKHHKIPTDADGFTSIDPMSIMFYPFPQNVYLDTNFDHHNKTLSLQDPFYIRRLYHPKIGKRPEVAVNAICRRLGYSDINLKLYNYAMKVWSVKSQSQISVNISNSNVGAYFANASGNITLPTAIGNFSGGQLVLGGSNSVLSQTNITKIEQNAVNMNDSNGIAIMKGGTVYMRVDNDTKCTNCGKKKKGGKFCHECGIRFV